MDISKILYGYTNSTYYVCQNYFSKEYRIMVDVYDPREWRLIVSFDSYIEANYYYHALLNRQLCVADGRDSDLTSLINL